MDEKENMHAARFQTYLEKWGGKLFGLKSMHVRAILTTSQSSLSKMIKLLYLPLILRIHAVWVNSVCGWQAEMDVCTATYIHGWGFKNDRVTAYSCSVME